MHGGATAVLELQISSVFPGPYAYITLHHSALNILHCFRMHTEGFTNVVQRIGNRV